LTYRRLGREEDYFSELAQAIKLKPEWPDPRLSLAKTLVDKGKCPEAISLIRSAPAFEPRFAPILESCPAGAR